MLFDILIAAFLAFITSYLYKLRKIYRKLRLKSIKHCGRNLLKITASLLQTATENYYKLRYLFYKIRKKVITTYLKNLLQITAAQISPKFLIIIINCFNCYKKIR